MYSVLPPLSWKRVASASGGVFGTAWAWARATVVVAVVAEDEPAANTFITPMAAHTATSALAPILIPQLPVSTDPETPKLRTRV